MSISHISVPKEQLAAFCSRSGIRRLALFGSVLTDRFAETSDVDVLVEFQPDYRIGHLGVAALERELSPFFGGRKVDLRTPGDLSHYFRGKVMRTALVQYAAE